MRVGILALVMIFILSGGKHLQNSGISMKGTKIENKRQLGFGLLLLFVGILILIYYFATLL